MTDSDPRIRLGSLLREYRGENVSTTPITQGCGALVYDEAGVRRRIRREVFEK